MIEQDTTNSLVKRIEKTINEKILTNEEIALGQLNKIISKLPPHARYIIEEAFAHKRIPKEYLLSSILYAFGNAAGLAFKIKWDGYTNYSNLYFAIIGSRGDTKSEAMKLACEPIQKFDDKEYNTYNEKLREKKSQLDIEEEPSNLTRKQLLIQNATIEAAMYVHYQNPYSIGMFFDELSYIIEKMANKNSNEGGEWRNFLLQGSTNSYVDVRRKTVESFRLTKSFPSLIGSIQHQFIPKMFASGNLESGLMDRFLFTNKLTNNTKISKAQISEGIISNYEQSLNNVLNYRTHIEASHEELMINFEKEAYDSLHDYSQSILDNKQQSTGPENEYMSKMMISIHKLVLVLHLISKAMDNKYQDKISMETVHLGILMNDYFLTHFKIVLESRNAKIDRKLFTEELIKKSVQNDVSQKEVVKITGHSKGQISKLYKKQISLETGNL